MSEFESTHPALAGVQVRKICALVDSACSVISATNIEGARQERISSSAYCAPTRLEDPAAVTKSDTYSECLGDPLDVHLRFNRSVYAEG